MRTTADDILIVCGWIADTEMPLMGELQESQPLESMSASSPSQAIVDVVENMRAKIHALFCKVGYTELSGMSTEDYVTLTIIEQYLNLKVFPVLRATSTTSTV